jgi:polysaccharide export outer membrane protein
MPLHLNFRGTAFCAFVASIFLIFFAAACQSPSGPRPTDADTVPPLLKLSTGDILEIIFPGATNLNSVHRIGPEGTINLPLIGPVQAAGLTSEQLQNELVKLFQNELNESNIIVSIANSANAVYVTGAVLRPGRVQLDRPLTALEVIMEASGFTPTANRKTVTVIRYIGEKNTIIELDLDPLLVGGPVPPFYVKPRDVIHVPTKIQWF